MRSVLAVLVVWVVFLRTISAAPLSALQAGAAAQAWMHAGGAAIASGKASSLSRVQSVSNQHGVVLYHVAELAAGGYLVLAADDRLDPVVAYADEGGYDGGDANPLGIMLRRDLASRLARVQAAGPAVAATDTGPRAKWARLLAQAQGTGVGIETLSSGSITDLRVAPFVQSVWDQTSVGGNACYNYYTPPYGEGTVSNYPCGCVGAAMAQAMRYWQWPVTGVGTAAYAIEYLVSTGYVAATARTLGGDGAGGPYVWSNMVLNPASGATLAQRKAIGALCADIAEAGLTTFRASGSGAWMLDMKNAATGPYGYQNGICYEPHGTNNIGPSLLAMMNPNLDARCPVLLGVDGPTLGHCVVGDGYGYVLSTLYHHLNFGWSGAYSVWYALPEDGLITSVSACIYNLFPTNTGEIISGRISCGSNQPVASAVVVADREGGGRYCATSGVSGVYALPAIPASSGYTVQVAVAGHVFPARLASTGYSSDASPVPGNLWGVDFASSEPMVSLGLSANQIPETGGVATVTATLSATSAVPVSVVLGFSGTASSSVDYAVSSGTMIIPPGALNASVTLTALGDLVREGNETVQVDILSVTNGWESATQQAVVTILEGPSRPDPPSLLRLVTTNSARIELSWRPNVSNDAVLVAWNETTNFGLPARAYLPGEVIPGGGKVLCSGTGTNLAFGGLASAMPYAFQAWSWNGMYYSLPVSAATSTPNRTSLPFTEGFEDVNVYSGTGWGQVFVTSNPITAWGLTGTNSGVHHGGLRCTSLFNYSNCINRLVSPLLDFGTGAGHGQLSFWYKMAMLSSSQDILTIQYRTNATQSWTALAVCSNSVTEWTNLTLALPTLGNSSFIAFEGHVQGGYGIYLDDVVVTADYPAPSGFATWAIWHCPGACASDYFSQDRDGDGVPNGLEFAFGSNLVPSSLLLDIHPSNGTVIVDTPQSIPAATSSVGVLLEHLADLGTTSWTTNGIHAITGGGKPPQRAWFQPDTGLGQAFFRLRAILLE